MITLWTYYRVTFDFLGKLCASVPANPDLTTVWLESRQPKVRPPSSRTIAEINEEVTATMLAGESEERPPSLLVFQRVDGKIVLRAATVRAHIKDCARVISAQAISRIKGERAFSTKVINGVYHDETQYWLPVLDQSDNAVSEPTGRHEKPIRFRLPDGGYQSAIKVFEYVENARVRFRLKVLGKVPGLQDLQTIFMYGAVHGYGGERGDGEGRYTYKIEQENENGRDETNDESRAS